MLIIPKRNTDIFALRADAIVNPTNASGVMGAGLAKQFRLRFPEYHDDYVAEHRRGKLCMGTVHGYFNQPSNQLLISLHTMFHPGGKVDLVAIVDGLVDLITLLRSYPNVKTIAVPALGCGIGGADWLHVLLPLMVETISAYDSDHTWFLLQPR